MNRISNLAKIALIGVFAISANQAALAQDDGPFFGKHAKGKWIVGIKAAKIENNIEEIKDADGFGIVLGYQFDSPVGSNGTSSVELEYISGDDTNIQTVASYDADILNLFFTYRSPGTLYFKAKAGLSYSDIELNSPAFRSTNEDVAFALGLGIGYHIGDYGVVELEYSADSGENDLGVLGLNALLEF